jgi:hypothetical protein
VINPPTPCGYIQFFYFTRRAWDRKKILKNRVLLQIIRKMYRNFVVCGCLKHIPPKSLTVINGLIKCLLWIDRELFITLKLGAWLCRQKFAQDFTFKIHLFLQNIYIFMLLIYIFTFLTCFTIRFVIVAAFIIWDIDILRYCAIS